MQKDCLNTNLDELLETYYEDKIIDYLSLDMEVIGERYMLLEKILKTKYSFKVITIEHDSYLGNDYVIKEKIPQRELLKQNGYILLCGDVAQKKHPNLYYEDWWVNSNFFTSEELFDWYSDKLSCDKIFDKKNIKYKINEISENW